MNLSDFADTIEEKLLKKLNLKTQTKATITVSGDKTERKVEPAEQISKLMDNMVLFLRDFIEEFRDEHDLEFVTDKIVDDNIELFLLDFEERFKSDFAQFSKRNDDSYKLPDLVDEISRNFGKFAFNILS